MKLGINIQYVNGNCWNGFQGQRSKVTVMAKPNAFLMHKDSHQLMPFLSPSVRCASSGSILILINGVAYYRLTRLYVFHVELYSSNRP